MGLRGKNMAAGPTYDCLAVTTISSTSDTFITLNNISQSYTDLVVICNMFWSDQDITYIRFNNDSGTNYSTQHLVVDVTDIVTSDSTTNQNAGFLGRFGTNVANSPFTATPFSFGTQIIHVNNYKNTGSFKSALCRNSNYSRPPYGVGISAVLWKSTSAISRIDLVGGGGTYIMPGSTVKLYGIAEA